jgi:hypothetical protein
MCLCPSSLVCGPLEEFGGHHLVFAWRKVDRRSQGSEPACLEAHIENRTSPLFNWLMARRIFQFKRGKANTQLNSAAEAAEFPQSSPPSGTKCSQARKCCHDHRSQSQIGLNKLCVLYQALRYERASQDCCSTGQGPLSLPTCLTTSP